MPTHKSHINDNPAANIRAHDLAATLKIMNQLDLLYVYVKYNRYNFNRRLLMLPYRVLMTLLARYRHIRQFSKYGAHGQASIEGPEGKELPDGSYFKLNFDSDTANIDFSLTKPSFRAALPHMFTTSVVWANLKPVKRQHSEVLTARASDIHNLPADCQKIIDVFLSYLYAVHVAIRQYTEILAFDERHKELTQTPKDLRLKRKIAAGPYSFKKLFGMPPKQFFNQ